ncbi:MAG: hypothetical protein WBX25_32275 [Rhodomicrobium sp.]
MPKIDEGCEVLAGPVERVTFHNEENGFCVLRVNARGHKDLVTVIGHAFQDVLAENRCMKTSNISPWV